MTTKEKSDIKTNIQASISLDWIIDLTEKLNEFEHRKILLEMKEYYNKNAINILRESNVNKITVYPKRDTSITLTINC